MSVSYSQDGMVVWLRLNRPDALNALSREMLHELKRAVATAQADPGVRVVILTGSGQAFCAGGDIKALLADVVGVGQARGGQPDYLDVVTDTFAAVRGLTKPLIACVNGVAMGGGLELMLCSDLVVAADTARIGDGHANFCIFPGGGSAALLPRWLPPSLAKWLLFTGETMPAAEWKHYGLVNEVVPAASLEAAAHRLALQLAQKSPVLLERLKRLSNGTGDMTTAEALQKELAELREHTRSSDMREGLTAFVEKRPPLYTGH